MKFILSNNFFFEYKILKLNKPELSKIYYIYYLFQTIPKL